MQLFKWKRCQLDFLLAQEKFQAARVVSYTFWPIVGFSFLLRDLEKSSTLHVPHKFKNGVSVNKLLAVRRSDKTLFRACYLMTKNNSIWDSWGILSHSLNDHLNSVHCCWIGQWNHISIYIYLLDMLNTLTKESFHLAECPSSQDAGWIWGCRLLVNASHPTAW